MRPGRRRRAATPTRLACPWWSHQPAAQDRARRGGGRDLGAVPPRQPGQEHRRGDGERAVDDHDGLQAGAASAAGLPADLPVGAHARLLVLAGAPVGVEFVAQVTERVGLALGVGREGGADRGEQVRAVQPYRLEFRSSPAEVGEDRRQVGECSIDEPEDARQRWRDGGEPGDDVAGDVVSGCDLTRAVAFIARPSSGRLPPGRAARPRAARSQPTRRCR